jgi:peptide chain release factor 1
MKLLRSKLYQLKLDEQLNSISGDRKAQVGTGSRSEKIRTYNWKDNRCTDHRLGVNYPLNVVLGGQLAPIINSCLLQQQETLLNEMGS